MGTTGTIVNGRIEMDEPGIFPEGAKVWIDNWDESMEELDDDYPVPPPDCTYQEHLAILRQSIADATAGLGIPFDEAMAKLRAEFEVSPEGGRAK